MQEVSVAAHRKGAIPRDTIADVKGIARIYTITKEIAMAAAKREAELKDISDEHESKRSPNKPLSKQEEINRVCENRRRKWDCFHIATAQVLECSTMYCTDGNLQKRPKQMGIKNLDIIEPPEALRKITGPLYEQDEEGLSKLKKTKPSKPPSEEYSRFEKLARQLISVPKSEIDKRQAEYEKKKAAKRRKAA